MSLRAEIRSLKRRLPVQPWLFARLADLLRREGRDGEALELLREGVARYPAYSSGWQKLGELQAEQGRHAEALRAWERCCENQPGICAAWISRLDAARVDPERHRELLVEAHRRDLFSLARLREMEAIGLVDRGDYEQSLRLTESEKRQREASYTRLMERMSPTDGGQDAAPETGPEEDSAVAESPWTAAAAATPHEIDEPPTEAADDVSAAGPASHADAGDAAGTATLADDPQAAAATEPAGTAADTVGDAPDHALDDTVAVAHDDDDVDDVAEAEVDEPPAASPAPPPNPARDGRIAASAEHLRRLKEPRPEPPPPPPPAPTARPGAGVRGAASVRTRRLAQIYAGQGYWDLAIRVLEDVRQREPGAGDLTAKIAELRRLKREAVEATRLRSAAARRRPS